MSQTLTSSSRSFTLPNFANDGFKELITQSFAKNYTLDNTLYIDFLTTARGGWSILFDVLAASEYATLRSLFNDQFTNQEFLTFTDTDLGITNMSVFMNLPSERMIKWNKQYVNDFIITIERKTAD